MTVSLPEVFVHMAKTGNASVIPFIGDQTVRILRKLLLTVNNKVTQRNKGGCLVVAASISSTRAEKITPNYLEEMHLDSSVGRGQLRAQRKRRVVRDYQPPEDSPM